MKLTFLGTAAAEGYPALWCRCQRCTVARQRGGRNLRFRSALLVNDDLLFDAGPDLVASAVRLNADLAPVQALLITHPHTDHLDPSTFHWRRKGFVATPLPVLDIYGSQASLAKVSPAELRERAFDGWRLRARPIGLLERFEIATGGPLPADPRFAEGPGMVPATPPRRYEALALGARHATPDLEPMFYAIRQVDGPEAKRRGAPPGLLYATDTGPFPDETWTALQRLADQGWRFSAAVIDATNGAGKEGTAHMNLGQMAWHHQELARRGLLAADALRFAHHFSHNGTPPYEELSALLAPEGIQSTYDGLVVEL